MEPVGSLSYSQEPFTGLYTKPDESSPCPQSNFSTIHSNGVARSLMGGRVCLLSVIVCSNKSFATV
jgi:hypothetical protein